MIDSVILLIRKEGYDDTCVAVELGHVKSYATRVKLSSDDFAHIVHIAPRLSFSRQTLDIPNSEDESLRRNIRVAPCD